jgi:hypothetical protein
MTRSDAKRRLGFAAVLGAGLLAVAGFTGCQVDVGGQTLPSPYYLQDDVQYFPPGSPFKLQREADALKAAQEQQALQR